MSEYKGDINPGEVIEWLDDSRYFDVLTDLAGSPALSVYKTNNTGESTAGVTLTAPYDSRTGLFKVKIDTSADGSFYAAANDFTVVITTGTLGGVSVVGKTIAHFSIQNRSPLRPTVANKTLDVTATGEAGIDWANIGSPTSANNFTATQIQSVNNLASGTDSINTIATAGSTLTTGSTVSGTFASTANLDGTSWRISDTAGTLDMYFEFDVGAFGVPTTAAWAGGLTTAANSLKVFAYNWAGAVWDQVGTINGTATLIAESAEFDFTTAHVGTGGNLGLVRLRFQNTGLVSANFYTDQVLCGYTNVHTYPTNFGSLSIDGSGRVDLGNILGTAVSAPATAGVLDVNIKNINNVVAATPGAAGGIAIAGANAATTFATLTITGAMTINGVSNVAQTGDSFIRLGAPAGASVSADIAAINAKTTNLPPDPADASDIAAAFAAVGAALVAINAKTTNLPASPAATGDQMALTAAAIDAIIDDAVDGTITLRQLLRGYAAAMLGKVSGMDVNAPIFRDINDTKDRITATTDADGNRLTIVLDLT